MISKTDLDASLCRLTRVNPDDFVILDVSEALKAKEKMTHKVSGPLKVLDVVKQTVSQHRGDFVQGASLDRFTCAPTLPREKPSPENTAEVKRGISTRSQPAVSKPMVP